MAGDFPSISSDIVSQWPKPNTVEPITRGWYLELSVIIAFTATIVFCTRLWSQIRKSTDGFGVDDGFACLGWVFASLFTGLSVLGTVKFGFDRHIWDVPDALVGRAALVQWLSEGAFVLSTCFTKISALLFFCRLEPPCPQPLKRIICAFVAFTACYSIACLLTQILLCHPISAYWISPRFHVSGQRSCASQHIYYPLQGSLSSFSTWYSTMIPVLVLRNVPMSKFQRIGLRVVCIFGLCVLGLGITRTYFLFRLENSANGDATWNGLNVFIWSQLECQFSLTAASLPYLQRYVSHYPSVPIVYIQPDGKSRNDSVMSRVSSTLSNQIRRLPAGRRSISPRNDISTPQIMEIPEWEFDGLESPRTVHVRGDEITYDRYIQGQFGPAPPPKDSSEIFYQYRREHGEFV